MLDNGRNMIRVAVAEDDKDYRIKLKEYLERYAGEKHRIVKTHFYTDGDGLVEDYRMQYDIILMDIQMKFMDGMSAAREIRKVDPEVVIIFITNMDQYATKGYEVDALDYVLKPVSYFMFSEKLDRAVMRMKNRSAEYLLIDIKGGMKKIDMTQILYIESQGHAVIFHTLSGEITGTGAMKDYEKKLSGYYFCRCNKGFLVNLRFVDGVSGGFVELGGEKLGLSRTRKTPFMQALMDYMSRVVK